MPPSGTTAGTVPDRPAALRLRGPGGGIPQASSVVARLSVAPAGNAPSTTLSHQNSPEVASVKIEKSYRPLII
ncbi:hypothetical protein CK504_002180 [Klebsiella pneumoniae]|nr:hypothetical protein CK504_002180 [Klebsiella pneumoniae]